MSIQTSKWAACGVLTLGVCMLAGAGGLAADDDDKKAAAAARQAVIDVAGGKGDPAEVAKKHAIENVMKSFKLRDKGGMGVGAKPGAITPDGIEAKIINLGKKAPTKAELAKQAGDLVKAAEITNAIGQIAEFYAPTKKEGDKDPKAWKKFNGDMIKSSKDLADALKMADGMKVKAAAAKLNQSCNECHAIFRVD